MKNRFTRWAVVMGVVLIFMSTIPVVGVACFFCDEPIHEETTVEETIPEETTIPDTDVI